MNKPAGSRARTTSPQSRARTVVGRRPIPRCHRGSCALGGLLILARAGDGVATDRGLGSAMIYKTQSPHDPAPQGRLVAFSHSIRETLADQFGTAWRAKTTQELATEAQLVEVLGREQTRRADSLPRSRRSTQVRIRTFEQSPRITRGSTDDLGTSDRCIRQEDPDQTRTKDSRPATTDCPAAAIHAEGQPGRDRRCAVLKQQAFSMPSGSRRPCRTARPSCRFCTDRSATARARSCRTSIGSRLRVHWRSWFRHFHRVSGPGIPDRRSTTRCRRPGERGRCLSRLMSRSTIDPTGEVCSRTNARSRGANDWSLEILVSLSRRTTDVGVLAPPVARFDRSSQLERGDDDLDGCDFQVADPYGFSQACDVTRGQRRQLGDRPGFDDFRLRFHGGLFGRHWRPAPRRSEILAPSKRTQVRASVTALE